MSNTRRITAIFLSAPVLDKMLLTSTGGTDRKSIGRAPSSSRCLYLLQNQNYESWGNLTIDYDNCDEICPNYLAN